MISRLRSAISLFTCWCFLINTVSAAPDNIGLLMTTGEVQVNGVPVPGNSAIFSGNRIASGSAISNLRFSDGTSAVMRPGGQMTVYREHSVLLQGVAMQRGADKHPVIADGLKISGVTPNAVVLVGVKDESHFEVAAEGGKLEVRALAGNLIARVEPGKNISFTISQAPAGTQENAVLLCGPLPRNGQLTDSTSNITYVLQGTTDLEPYFGQTVAVIGRVTNPSAVPPTVSVSSIKVVPTCVVTAPGAAPSASTFSSGKGLLLAALAVAGLGVGLYFAVTSPSAPAPPPVTPAVP
jgi:hypothetical protein